MYILYFQQQDIKIIMVLFSLLFAGVELPTSPYTSKDKGGLVNLPNN